jgi:hypothetical protein
MTILALSYIISSKGTFFGGKIMFTRFIGLTESELRFLVLIILLIALEKQLSNFIQNIVYKADV